jgi:hypothetical protein
LQLSSIILSACASLFCPFVYDKEVLFGTMTPDVNITDKWVI